MVSSVLPGIDLIREAQEFLKGRIVRTPMVGSATFSEQFGCRIMFKMENMQKTGSFKIRGALFRISKIPREEAGKGVVTASAGNHAQGVAYAARASGIRAKIVMPEYTTPAKVSAVKGYGAEVVLYGQDYSEARAKAGEIAAKEDMTFIEAFNDPYVIAGQGTIGLEMLQDFPEMDTVLVPVGGGGLISGIATAVKSLKPDVRVIGVQSENADSMKVSLEKGIIVEHTTGFTIADGIAVKYPGDLTLQVCRKYVDEIVTVSDETIALALFKLLERKKTLVEPSGAAGLAAVMEGKVDVSGRNVGIVLSGGNANLLLLSKIIYKSLEIEERLVRIDFKIPDRPGTLWRISNAISSVGGNIYHAEVDNLARDTPVGYQSVRFTVNVRDSEHAAALVEKLKTLGFSFQVVS